MTQIIEHRYYDPILQDWYWVRVLDFSEQETRMHLITPMEAEKQFPKDFADDNVYDVVINAIVNGDAMLMVVEGKLIYHDPLFGDDCPVSELRYNNDIGLNRRKG
jgi:hypothetical protein